MWWAKPRALFECSTCTTQHPRHHSQAVGRFWFLARSAKCDTWRGSTASVFWTSMPWRRTSIRPVFFYGYLWYSMIIWITTSMDIWPLNKYTMDIDLVWLEWWSINVTYPLYDPLCIFRADSHIVWFDKAFSWYAPAIFQHQWITRCGHVEPCNDE